MTRLIKLDNIKKHGMTNHFFKGAGLSVLALQFIFYSSAWGQFSGKITDSQTGKPVAGAEVFINNTTFVTATDDAGQFNLKCALTGFYDIVLHKEGYSVYRSSI